MRIIKINPDDLRASRPALEEAVECLGKGGIIVYPTDTVYGLGADIFDLRGVKWIYKIKQRDKNKPLPVIVSGIEKAKELAVIDKKQEKFLDKVWPGAVTVIFHKKTKTPGIVCGERGTVGLRVPDYKITFALLEMLGSPLTATSANISGELPCSSAEEVVAQFRDTFIKPDLILDAGKLTNNQPSTIIDFTENRPRIVRVGPISKEQLLNFFGEKKKD